MRDHTCGTFMNGRLRIRQPRRGYRFSIDAVILAASVNPCRGDVVLDLGTGCGIIALILASRHPDIRVIGVEVQQELAELAAANVKDNGMQDRIEVLHVDLRTVRPDLIGPVNWVVSNPPYRRFNSGRINPDSQKALARHEIKLTLPQLMTGASRLMRPGDRFAAIYSAERTVDLLTAMRASNVEPKRLQSIHSHAREAGRLVLAHGTKGAGPALMMAQPLIIYNTDGGYSDIIQSMMAP